MLPETEKIRKKHKSEEMAEENENPKKVRLFSAKDFRKQLSSGNKLKLLENFITAIKNEEKHDYVYEYLENGGNCLELLQQLEADSTLDPCVVFELVTHVLLTINAKYPQFENSAVEACRYMLNHYISIINKMINLSSSAHERYTVLKLLTAIATLSVNLAKDVLINVNFNQTNLELLTKHTGQKNSVRDIFVQFLVGFLVDGHYPSLSVLLEKRGLLTSIVRDLQYDNWETVCLVISAMKNHILENPSVTKTTKMKTFNTSIIKEIVNLYNWKGPGQKNIKNNTPKEIDEQSKLKVSECVHEFLLVLCTSHKFGVIFRDHTMGLGKKHQNTLVYTVLEGLDRPWEHSYAGDLVVKICGACPDLAKNVWNNLKPFLELRPTQKWLNALNFTKRILHELQPSCLDFCAKDLTDYQLTQVISFLILPLPILNVVVPKEFAFESHVLKQYVVALLNDMLKTLMLYVEQSKSWLKQEGFKKLKQNLSNVIARNFPNSIQLLNDWNLTETTEQIQSLDSVQHLCNILDLFDAYKTIAPQLLDNLNIQNDLFLSINDIIEDEERVREIQTKAVDIMLDFDATLFTTKSDLFSFVLPLFLRYYHSQPDKNCLKVLNKLLGITNIFLGCEAEINIWINAVLDLKEVDESICDVLLNVLKLTSDNVLELTDKLSKLIHVEESISFDLENLQNDSFKSGEKNCLKRVNLSPLILGILEYIEENNLTKNKSVKAYIKFVFLNLYYRQTDQNSLKNFVENYNIITKEFLEFFNTPEVVVYKSKGRLDIFEKFGQNFLTGNSENFEITQELYPDLGLNLLQMFLFYLNKLAYTDSLSETHIKNFENFVKVNKISVETILSNVNVFHNFSPLLLNKNNSSGLFTQLIINIVKEFREKNCNFEEFLNVYRHKLVKAATKIAKKPAKYESLTNFVEVLPVFNLNYAQCCEILEQIYEIDSNFSKICFEITVFCLNRIVSLENIEPLSSKLVKKLTKNFAQLQEFDVSPLSKSLKNYLDQFPHDIENVDKNLAARLARLNEYNKDNVSLFVLLTEKLNLLDEIKNNIDMICEKKFLILPLLQILIDSCDDNKFLVYEKFEASIAKALAKPQKAGQHFLQNYPGLGNLLEHCMPVEDCKKLFEKVQKYEVAEIFHANLLNIASKKILTQEIESKYVDNIIMTFIHLHMVLFKRKTSDKLPELAKMFSDILDRILTLNCTDLKNATQNETFKLFCKFALKFGVSGHHDLLKILIKLIKIFDTKFDAKEAAVVFEMLLSHSEFLDVVLGDFSACKYHVLALFLTLTQNWQNLMERSHVPVLLAAYKATVHPCDKIVLALLKTYESHSDTTHFSDFKPYLWDRAAASHYSVRTAIENKLLRQPKMSDVLDILQDHLIRSTLTNYSLNETLEIQTVVDYKEEDLNKKSECYDLAFLLPLFSQLLATENQVQTYRFSRSGALALTIVALSSPDESTRKAACHVLSRFYYHLEAKQTGKDNLLWIRFIEAICKGTALLEDFRLNNFTSIYLARTSLVLTQPNHVMYVPMSQYLTAKQSLDFSTVPELYTYLHSSDVSYKDHRLFALELLRDGVRSEKDFMDFLKSMAFKLFSELYSSCISDVETQTVILDVVKNVCKQPLGVKVLCENHSLLTQLSSMLARILNSRFKEKNELFDNVGRIVSVLLLIVKTLTMSNVDFVVFKMIFSVIDDSELFARMSQNCEELFEVLYLLYGRRPELFADHHFNLLLKHCDDKFCKYVSKYGCKHVSIDETSKLRLLFYSRFVTRE